MYYEVQNDTEKGFPSIPCDCSTTQSVEHSNNTLFAGNPHESPKSKNTHLNTQIKEDPNQEYDFQNATYREHVEFNSTKVIVFECSQCKYAVSHNSNLVQHVRTVHNAEKRYKCSQCNYERFNHSRLSNHVKSVHNKEKVFDVINVAMQRFIMGIS